jgi:hypothetical protein
MDILCQYKKIQDTDILFQIEVGWQILAGGSLLRGGQTQVGEPRIGEHAQ